jgi:serine/threonine-protein kinase
VSALDETLRAIVAADRSALKDAAEAKHLLGKRLRVFYGYFALLSVLAVVTGGARSALADVEPRVLAVVVAVQAAHALLLCATFAGLSLRLQRNVVVHALDTIAALATALTAAIALSVVPRALTVDVSAVSFFVLFFSLRAAIVPAKPWVAVTTALVCAVPFSVGLLKLYNHAGVAAPERAAFASIRALLAGVAGVYVVSKTIYGLRRVVEEAVRFGQYVVHEKIGEGGMGAVYRASHALLKRPTAVKVIVPRRSSPTANARFEREVMAASRLSHPNNVAIYDYGCTRGGVFYYAMEFLEGEDLARLVKRSGPQPVDRTLHILRQLTAALAEAHADGLVHRDVKPANIMLCTRGLMPDFVKVLDFGMVKDVTADGDVKITAENTIAGTPLYMAPESIVDPSGVGPPADIYAVGCVAYFLLTGRPPFIGTSVIEICMAHVHTAPEPPSAHAPAPIPPRLDELILQCLDKNPQLRPSALALSERFGVPML